VEELSNLELESYGIECARLAGMPESILEVAAERAQEFQNATEVRIKQNKISKFLKVLKRGESDEAPQPETILSELKNLVETLSIST